MTEIGHNFLRLSKNSASDFRPTVIQSDMADVTVCYGRLFDLYVFFENFQILLHHLNAISLSSFHNLYVQLLSTILASYLAIRD